MTALLTGNLPLLAGAPNGIKKLRELILELAVRGKLVAQDPNDEPAIELLKRIAEEKARLVVEGKIKKQKPQTDRDAEDQAFDLPAGWAWTRLSDVVNVLNGRAYKKEELLDAGTPVLRVGNLFTSNHWYYSTLTLEEDKYCNPGDLLFAWSASFGPFIWHGERSIYHYHIWKLDFYAKGQLNKHYLYNFLLEQTQEIKASGHGVSMVHMTKEKMEKLVVPLPPLAEQHRIVDKVDELMALCDRLEAQQAGAESARDQLVQALLDSLTQVRDASEFATNWQRLAEHFHTLFTTAPSIDALKQTLLQLAVMGKLVPQNPNDELASELLKRIAEEKARLVDEGKIKKQKPPPKLGEEEKPYALPKGWEWCRINDLVSIKHGYAFSSSYFSESVCPFILTTPGHFFKTGGFRERGNRTKYYCGPVAQEFILDPSDLIVAMTEQTAGLLGSAAFVPKDGKTYLHNQRLGKLIFNRELLSPEYLFHYFNGPFLRACIADSSTGMKVKHTSPEKIGLILLPLPSLAEQHRIVAKLDQLMALCDQLKPRLTQASQLSQQLASTLIERALAEDGQQTLVAPDQKTARTLLAAEITYRLHAQRTFGQRKLQKVIYLAEHAARLAAIQGNYLRNVAGPHDRQLMDQVESELQNHQWYECIEREAFGHAYRPLSQAGRHHPAYESVWGTAERTIIEQVIELMRNWDTDRCEMTVTLYAVWNDFILEGRPVSDDSIVEEVMHSWNDTKLRFDKTKWSAILAEMKKHKILTPIGFGRRTLGGMLSLPGFD